MDFYFVSCILFNLDSLMPRHSVSFILTTLAISAFNKAGFDFTSYILKRVMRSKVEFMDS